jgi:hypothetical protein
MVDIHNHCIVTTEIGHLDSAYCTQASIDQMFANMAAVHESWIEDALTDKRRIVLFAHGGMVSRDEGLTYAVQTAEWWLSNRVYPIYFVWESSAIETIMDRLLALLQLHPYDPLDIVDPVIARIAVNYSAEQIVRDFPLIRNEWTTMKTNATGLFIAQGNQAKGGLEVLSRLASYRSQVGNSLEVHLVGHSAGANVHAQLLRINSVHIDSLTLLAPALRCDIFVTTIILALTEKRLSRLDLFCLGSQLELADICRLNGVPMYYGSLLWLVSRAFEWEQFGPSQVPISGMQYFLENAVDANPNLESRILELGGSVFYSPRGNDYFPDERTNALSHGGMAIEPTTMNSVLLRMLRKSSLQEIVQFPKLQAS